MVNDCCQSAHYEVLNASMPVKVNMKAKCNLFTSLMHFHAPFVYCSSVCVFMVYN